MLYRVSRRECSVYLVEAVEAGCRHFNWVFDFCVVTTLQERLGAIEPP